MDKKVKTPAVKEERQEIGLRDSVLVTYQSKCYNIKDIPGTITHINLNSQYPFRVEMSDKDKKPINVGHNGDGSEPGTGNVIFCKINQLKLVEKYVPVRLTGVDKKVWRINDKFTPRKGFGLELNAVPNDKTAVTPGMLKYLGKQLSVAVVIPRYGLTWIVDAQDNYFWLPEWIDPIE